MARTRVERIVSRSETLSSTSADVLQVSRANLWQSVSCGLDRKLGMF